MPDREIIIQLATRIMGWELDPQPSPVKGTYRLLCHDRPHIHNWDDGEGSQSWNPLRNLMDAWEVRDKLAPHYAFAFMSTPMHSSVMPYSCAIFEHSVHPPKYENWEHQFRGSDPDAARAIALAAYAIIRSGTEQKTLEFIAKESKKA